MKPAEIKLLRWRQAAARKADRYLGVIVEPLAEREVCFQRGKNPSILYIPSKQFTGEIKLENLSLTTDGKGNTVKSLDLRL